MRLFRLWHTRIATDTGHRIAGKQVLIWRDKALIVDPFELGDELDPLEVNARDKAPRERWSASRILRQVSRRLDERRAWWDRAR